MSLFITSLNSGSNGNCYYVGNQHEAVLIDVGISCREIEKRMANLQLSMLKVKAIFISHEHTDHIRGVSSLAAKYQIAVYITPLTLKRTQLIIPNQLLRTFSTRMPVAIGALQVTAFTKWHDAVEPHSFIIEDNGIKVGVFTDIGKLCKEVIHYFKQCNACFLESNYDEQMLEQGTYPVHLKNRIRGDRGHLSNQQAVELFINYRPTHLSHLLLSHLSKNNNCPNVVSELFNRHARQTQIMVASRYNETPVFSIQNKQPVVSRVVQTQKIKFVQMSLFQQEDADMMI